MKCLNSQLCETKVRLTRETNNYIHEQEKLSNDLGIKRRKINSLQAQYNEQCHKKRLDKKLMSTLIEIRNAICKYYILQQSGMSNNKIKGRALYE